ncbi:MAG: DNA-directed RNA polymerase subunit beta [Candidatus Portnoybacteria bacterium]|nr:DNA-directed RNA polymerase subunit beta [Candidatus Portnoybacteria bacterium]
MLKAKRFPSYPKNLKSLPSLVEIQLNSYNLFLERGLRELFDEISPVSDYSGKDLSLYFGDYYLDEPKCDELKAKKDGLSYEAPLKVKIKLVNKKTKETKEQEIFLTDLPVITPRGTFVVNGVERVVISQLIRSSGVFFTTDQVKGKKAHGAKIIPNRGAWLEFDTESNGSIVVRIDRKRKIAATTLLRIFGLDTSDKIRKEFKEIEKKSDINYIEKTLEQDSATNQDEAWIEIYKRLRPGDLAAVDNARQLIENMFKNFDRYDLSEVGRHKMNQRLRIKTPLDVKHRILRKEDIVLILKEIINLNNDPEAPGDDIDHLGNRRVRALGELLENKMRVGLSRMERIVRDRMSTMDAYDINPSQLINSRPLIAAVREFFTSSQLSQFMNQINPLSELEHKRRLSAMGPGGLTKERAGFEVRDLHPSHYGRICPIETPEGPNIGLVGHLASYAKINNYGFIETPYWRVKNGKITNELVYLDAFEEERYNIAQAGTKIDNNKKILGTMVEARIKGDPGVINKKKIDFIDVSPYQTISIATALIPFVEHDDSNRALMGSNMQRQAVPLIQPQAPLVGTGIEGKAAKDSGQVVVAENSGIVKEVDSSKIIVGSGSKKKEYSLHNFLRSNDYTSITQRPMVSLGQKIKKGDVLADSSSTDNGELALGQNLLVAFMPWKGANFEDAIIISERVVKEDRFSSVHIEEFNCEVRETKLGPETTTSDIPNVGEDRLKDLDEEGIIRVGAEVGPDDILVGKISPKGETDLTAEERLLRAIFGDKARDIKDTSLRLSHGKRGRVVGIKIFSRDKGDKLNTGVIKRIQVEVAQHRRISVGDKLAGRHGNKGVISKILPEEDMPYLDDGRPVDIILNPLGVASRMNIGQILETHLGWAASKLGYRAYTPPFSGVKEEEIKEELKKAGLPENGKVKLRDGRTGEHFIQPVTVGYIYMLKLNHLVEDKIHMRSIGPYSLITQQPLGGKAQFGGQRFGEMEVWALEGYGAAYTLQEMLTIKSDDVIGRTSAYDAIIKSKPIHNPHIPSSFNVLMSELKSLAFSVNVIKKEKKEKKVKKAEKKVKKTSKGSKKVKKESEKAEKRKQKKSSKEKEKIKKAKK